MRVNDFWSRTFSIALVVGLCVLAVAQAQTARQIAQKAFPSVVQIEKTARRTVSEEGIMETSFYFSAGAILISIISLIWSIHIGKRDRAELKATSTFYDSGSREHGGPFLKVKAGNYGRRPIILTALCSKSSSGHAWCTYLDQAVRLGENDKRDFTIEAYDTYTVSPRDGKEAVDLWFEDTLGRRYRIKNAKQHLKKLKELLSRAKKN